MLRPLHAPGAAGLVHGRAEVPLHCCCTPAAGSTLRPLTGPAVPPEYRYTRPAVMRPPPGHATGRNVKARSGYVYRSWPGEEGECDSQHNADCRPEGAGVSGD